MVHCRLAAHFPDSPPGIELFQLSNDPGPLLAVSSQRTPYRRGHSAARAPWTPAHGQHARRHLRLSRPGLHRQRVRRLRGRLLRRRRFRQHLPAGGRGHRPALSLLPSRVLQRHLFVCPGRRPGGPGHSRVRSFEMGSRRSYGDPADRDLPGDGSPAPDLAGSQGDRKMKRAAALFLLGSQLLAAALPESIQKLLDSSPAARTAFWGIRIVDLATGKTLYELNPDHYFVPASNAKLFSTALSLTRLGADFTFQTRVLAQTPPDEQGRIRGWLRLAGGGDPNLSARAVPYRMGSLTGDPLAAIEDLAGQLVARGVRRVDGDIIGDDTWYVWQPYAAGWAIDDPQSDDGPPISALTLADNVLTLSVRPGANIGDVAALSLLPAIEFYRIENRVRTVAAGGERRIRFQRIPGSRDAQLWGAIPLRDRGQDLLIGVEDPAQFAAQALRMALERRGVAVSGSAIAEHLYPDGLADLAQAPEPASPTGIELPRHVSAPLIEDLRITAKVSQNLHAELALRAVGRARRNVGSFEAGMAEMKTFLAEAGIDPAGYHLMDGSGLSRLDLVTPSTVLKLLRHMYDSPAREKWISILPVAAQDGTLSSRFGSTAAAGRVYAKTGTLSHVSALSGYLQRSDATWVAFSVLVNNYGGRSAAEIRGVMDRICNLILE